jgi:hypothetical protein
VTASRSCGESTAGLGGDSFDPGEAELLLERRRTRRRRSSWSSGGTPEGKWGRQTAADGRGVRRRTARDGWGRSQTRSLIGPDGRRIITIKGFFVKYHLYRASDIFRGTEGVVEIQTGTRSLRSENEVVTTIVPIYVPRGSVRHGSRENIIYS